MTSPVTHKLTLTHRELSLVIRGLRSVEAQITYAPNASRLRNTPSEEADEVKHLRTRLTAFYNPTPGGNS